MPANYTSVASQLYVWMQHYGSQGEEIEDYLGPVFETIKAAGIDVIEGWLPWFKTPDGAARIQARLADYQMQMPAVYHNAPLHDSTAAADSVDAVRDLAQNARDAVGCTTIVLNPEPIDWNDPIDKTDAQLATQAAALNTLGAALHPLGMRLVVHHHDAEMRNGAHEFYHILHNTDPGTVGFCLDYDWILRGGQSPMRLLQDCGPRVQHMHLRNMHNRRWMRTLNYGDIDYTAIHAHLDAIDYAGALVIELAYEKDMLPADDLDTPMQTSRAFVREVFGV